MNIAIGAFQIIRLDDCDQDSGEETILHLNERGTSINGDNFLLKDIVEMNVETEEWKVKSIPEYNLRKFLSMFSGFPAIILL